MSGNLAAAAYCTAECEQPGLAGSGHSDPRVAVPMIVEIDNTRSNVSEWNTSGFALEKPLLGAKLEDVRSAHVVLRINDVDIGFDIPCQVAKETELGAVDFKFLGAFTQQAALLYRVAEDHLSGHATQIDLLLCSSPLRFSRKRRKLVLATLVSILAVSIVMLATVVLTSLLTVRSRVGAVTVEGTILRAPATGVLTGDLLPPDSIVHEGQPLFQVVTADMTAKVAELSAELQRLRVSSDYSRARLRVIKELTSNVRNLTEQKLDTIKAKITALDSQIALYTKLVNNKQFLADHGFHPQSGVDVQRVDLEGRREARDDAQSDLQTASTQTELLKSGVFSLDWRDSMETTETMRLLVAESEASVAKAEAMLNAIGQANQVVSPCDCLVYATEAKRGEVVEAGALVYALRPARVAPMVVAMIPADQTDGLTIGNPASVSLESGLFIGRLEKLSYDDQATSQVGLFPFVRSSTASTAEQQMAQATISLRDNVDASLIGTPAQVAIRSNPVPRVVSGLYALLASL